MADWLNLGLDDVTDTDNKIDLLGGAFAYRRGAWIPKAGEAGQRVIETIPLLATGSQADIIAGEHAISSCLESARRWFRDPWQESGRWLEWGIEAEPRGTSYQSYAPKRAFIYDGRLAMAATKDGAEPFPSHYLNANLVIERHPAWENVNFVSYNDSIVSFGDVQDLSAWLDYCGNLPARMADISMGSTDILYEYWLGIREAGAGYSDFDPVLELEDGTNGTDTTDAVDATASGGDKVTCSFATETGLDTRSTFSLSDIGGVSDYEHFAGRYLVLCRLKVGSSTECGIRLRSGFEKDGAPVPCEEVYIDNTSWLLVPLGEIGIPAMGYKSEYSLEVAGLDDFAITIEAERLSGSGSLDLDCLYLIPSAHLAYLKCEGSGLVSGVSANIFTMPDDTHSVFFLESGDPVAVSEFNLSDWFVPTNVGFAVAAAQGASSHSLTATHTLNIDFAPRWAMFRGQ